MTPRDLYEELVPPGSVWRSPLATEVCVRRLQQHTLGPVSATLVSGTGGEVTFDGRVTSRGVRLRRPSVWASPFSFRLVAELTPDQDGGTLLRGSLGVARTKMIVVGLFLLVLVVFGHGLTLGVATLVSAVVVEVLYGAAFVLVSRRGRPSHVAYVDGALERVAGFVPVPRDP